MARSLFGKIVRLLKAGEKMPQSGDAAFGKQDTVSVTSEKVDIYDGIFAEGSMPGERGKIDSTVAEILSTIANSEEERREEIIAACRNILAENDQSEKTRKIEDLVSIGLGIDAIALHIIMLKEMTRFSGSQTG